MKVQRFFVVKTTSEKTITLATYSANADNAAEKQQVLNEAAAFLDGYAQAFTDCNAEILYSPCVKSIEGYIYTPADCRFSLAVVTGSDDVEICHTATKKDVK